jgi:hypothetical protein
VPLEVTKSSIGSTVESEDALLDKADVNEEKRDDWEEVQNYVKVNKNFYKGIVISAM